MRKSFRRLWNRLRTSKNIWSNLEYQGMPLEENPLGSGSSNRGEQHPCWQGDSKGNSVLLCLGCSEGIVFPFDRKNPKKPAVSWHTTFLGKSSVLYLCGADSSRNCSTPRKVWLQLRRSGGKGCPLRGSISDRKRLAGGADMHCLPAVSSAEMSNHPVIIKKNRSIV